MGLGIWENWGEERDLLSPPSIQLQLRRLRVECLWELDAVQHGDHARLVLRAQADCLASRAGHVKGGSGFKASMELERFNRRCPKSLE